eukprot:TRINITY_DN9454_c0_g1_i1.p1 TRINITY_DN9454_c0_g1~~TRINITY_DN9454_c0_g1_i1.p1  ORF type:complete len:946 (-),score=264.08 TRINITY_DN9454_c0_g1_i1:112-2949(-)
MAVRYWVPCEDHAWLPGTLVSDQDGKASFSVDAPNAKAACSITLPSGDLKGLALVRADQEDGVDDICALEEVGEAALLHTVRLRYSRNIIYTRVARTLIAMNPFQDLPIYSSQYVDRYVAAADTLNLPPHIFAPCRDALQDVRERNQAILIGGESGAGKTESAKLIMSFVADALCREMRAGAEERLDEAVLQSNPLLEAFGNAMTVKNANSSRFGKWLDLQINQKTELAGCVLTSYLLETTRVCTQAAKERGFHVFFQLIKSRAKPELAELKLMEPSKYRYLSSGRPTVPGVDDAQAFEDLCEAMTAVGLNEALRGEIFRLLGGVLILGNCEFTSDAAPDPARLVGKEELESAAKLFGVDADRLSDCLLFKEVTFGRETTKSPLRVEQAAAARDALARLIYGRLFEWIINFMNKRLQSKPSDDEDEQARRRCLGVLDIAGFERFELNSLEQLMINLSNEHLQQQFNRTVFKIELEDTEREGVTMPNDIGFVDNADCLTLIDGKAGVLDLLDETMVVPRATNNTYVQKVIKVQGGQSRLVASKIACLGFGVRHFAGVVQYDCEGWLEKNADRCPDNAPKLLASSTHTSLREIGEEIIAEASSEAVSLAKTGNAGKARRAKSVTARFRTSLKTLMVKIEEAHSHYIRCIKPNADNVPGRVAGSMVMEQLVLAGLLSTVRIRQNGYPHRVLLRHFVWQYRCVLRQAASKLKLPADGASLAELKRAADELLDLLPSAGVRVVDGDYAVGCTKIFLKSGAFKILEEHRKDVLGLTIVRLQAIMRGWRVNKRISSQRLAHRDIVAWHRRCNLSTRSASSSGSGVTESICVRIGSLAAAKQAEAEVGPLLTAASAAGLRNATVKSAESARRRLALELDAANQVAELAGSIDPVAIQAAIARVRSLHMEEELPALGELDARLRRLKTQLPLVQAMRSALGREETSADRRKSSL